MRSVALFLFLCRIVCAQTASLAGIAIDAITRQPLEGVHVSFYILRKNMGPLETYGAISGKDGRFSIGGMKPANYGLKAQLNGFVNPAIGNPNTRLALKAGENRADFTIELTPEAVITGRVVDDSGDPVQNAFIEATSIGAESELARELSRMQGRTDDRGEFRIKGLPGEFYVTADVTPWPVSIPEIRSDGSALPVYARTWYPESESRDHAVAVDAAPGRETAGIDIRLLRKRSLKISGVVTGTPEGAARAAVHLGNEHYNFPEATPDADGRFTFSGLSAGRYWVTAEYKSIDPPLISPAVDVMLDAADDSGVALKLAPGEQLSGTLGIEGGQPERSLAEKRTVVIQPLSDRIYVPRKGGETDRDGAFSVMPVYPGKYRVRVEPLPENAFVKTLRLDGLESTDGVVDLSRGVAGTKLSILIGLNGGQIEGTLSIEAGSKARGATVALATTLDDVDRKMMSVEPGKKYHFAGLRPGKYRLIAIGSDQMFSTDALKVLFGSAPEFEVREGDRIVRDVEIKVKESARAAPKVFERMELFQECGASCGGVGNPHSAGCQPNAT